MRQQVEDLAGEATTSYNIAMIYCEFGYLEETVSYIKQCVKLREEIEHPDTEKNRDTLLYWQKHLENQIPKSVVD